MLALAAAFASMAVVFVVKTFADAVFLAEFGAQYVPHFFVAQSAALIGTSFLYTYLIRWGSAITDSIILVALAGTALASPFLAARGGAALFALSIALITLSTLGQLAIWNTATSVVSGRKARTFLPRAGAAATAGAVVGGFASSGIVGLGGVTALAWVSGGLTLATLAMRLALAPVSGERRARPAEPRRTESARESARQLVWLLAAGVIVEAVLSAFIDFGFKRHVAGQFPSRDSIGLFFALYYGITNVILLVTQLSTASTLLATRSLRFTLSLQPAALAATAILWVAFPLLALGAMTRGFEGVMKFALARPAQEVAMTPLSERTRRRIKVILRGVFAPGGAALAGGVLIAAASFLDDSPSLVPALCAVFALAWLVISRATANHYLAALGSELGLRRMRDEEGQEALLDRDALARLVELSGNEDPSTAGFARRMLGQLVRTSAVLAPHVGSGNAATRRAVYQLLTEQPSRACAARLGAAVEREPDDEALDAGLLALAAHGDARLVERARKLVSGAEPGGGDALQRAAWLYLSRVKVLDADPEHHLRVLVGSIVADGASAALACGAAIARGAVSGDRIDEAIAELADATGDDAAARKQALLAAATLGRARGIERVIDELASGSPWAEAIASRLHGLALGRVCDRAASPELPSRHRVRLLAALRASDQPEVTDLAARALTDRDADVRDQAISVLLAHRERDDLPRGEIEKALGIQMDAFELYLRARPGFTSAARESQMVVRFRGTSADVTAEAFFLDELERCTERELGKLCKLLALLGSPDAVFDAERGLRAPTFKRRRQAVDVLQEVARGRQKTRLLELLELYLMPPRQISDGAREAVIAIDPWLARCASGNADPAARRLWALRSAILFDAVDGASLFQLAERASEVAIAAQEIVVREGEPGDALYIVIDGIVAVERGDAVVAQLGPGEAFGELALLDGEPRQATVRAQKPSRLLRLPRGPFDDALSAHPEIGLGLVLGLVKWLRQGRAAIPRAALRTTML